MVARSLPLARRMALLVAAVVLVAGMAPSSNVDDGLAAFAGGRFAEALAAWQAAADAGDAAGDLYIGVLYDTGQGVTQDYGKALDWYRRAAEAGSAAGAFNVGVLYDAGLGVAQSQSEAAQWYGRAAAGGFARADYNLALLYEQGAGVRRDRARAVALFRQAAAKGLTAAQTHLATLGERSPAVSTKPQPDTMTDFRRAQDMLLNRGAVEAGKVAVLFRRAADRHNALAEYDLGYCYEHGVGVPADLTSAYTWYQRAISDTQNGGLRSIAQDSASKLDRQIATRERTGPALAERQPGE